MRKGHCQQCNNPNNNWPTLTQGAQAITTELMKVLHDKVKDSTRSQAEKIQHLEQELKKAQQTSTSPDPSRKRSADHIPLSPSKRTKVEPSSSKMPNADQFLHPDTTRPLQTSSPTGSHHASITKWLKQIQEAMTPDDAKHMDKYLDQVATTWTKIDRTKRPNLQDLASQWGLPCQAAVNYSDTSLLKVSAAAAWIVAHKTA